MMLLYTCVKTSGCLFIVHLQKPDVKSAKALLDKLTFKVMVLVSILSRITKLKQVEVNKDIELVLY